MKWRVFVGITLRAIISKALRLSVYFNLFLVCFSVYYYFRVFPLLEGLLFIYVVIVFFIISECCLSFPFTYFDSIMLFILYMCVCCKSYRFQDE